MLFAAAAGNIQAAYHASCMYMLVCYRCLCCVVVCFATCDWCHAAHPDATAKGNRRNINGSWNPFSTGPRNCIGQTLALAELRTVLAVMIGNFFFELPEGVQREAFIKEEEVWWVSLQAKNGVQLDVQPIMEEKLPEPKGPRSSFFYEELTRLAKEAEEEACSR